MQNFLKLKPKAAFRSKDCFESECRIWALVCNLMILLYLLCELAQYLLFSNLAVLCSPLMYPQLYDETFLLAGYCILSLYNLTLHLDLALFLHQLFYLSTFTSTFMFSIKFSFVIILLILNSLYLVNTV